MSMSRLIIDAANGAEYLAKARLETDGGRVLAQGSAVLASRQAFNLVRQGEYTFARVRPFPQDDSVQKEFGPHGLLFDAADPVANEPLLVHGGDFEQAGRPKAACGSIRIDARLLAAIVKHVQGMGVSSARARLVLDVRVGSKPSALKFWAQPRREEQVFIDDDYDIDFFDVLDWVREHERRENQERRDHERREQDRREDERHERERAEAVACERAQGRVSDDDRKPAEQECSTNPDAGPLFKVSAPPGVDSQGRVLEADAHLGAMPEARRTRGPVWGGRHRHALFRRADTGRPGRRGSRRVRRRGLGGIGRRAVRRHGEHRSRHADGLPSPLGQRPRELGRVRHELLRLWIHMTPRTKPLRLRWRTFSKVLPRCPSSSSRSRLWR